MRPVARERRAGRVGLFARRSRLDRLIHAGLLGFGRMERGIKHGPGQERPQGYHGYPTELHGAIFQKSSPFLEPCLGCSTRSRASPMPERCVGRGRLGNLPERLSVSDDISSAVWQSALDDSWNASQKKRRHAEMLG